MERKLLGHFDAMFTKMKIEGDIRFHSHTLFSAPVGIVTTFRSHPDKSDREILKHRRRIAANLTKIYTSYSLHNKNSPPAVSRFFNKQYYIQLFRFIGPFDFHIKSLDL